MRFSVRSMRHKLTSASLIKKARLKSKLSQRALAKKSGIDPAMLCRIEGGRQAPELATVRKLAKALKVTLFSLLGDE